MSVRRAPTRPTLLRTRRRATTTQPSREARLEALANGLGKQYYDPAYDPVRKVLVSRRRAALPW